jgi:hypothetical protein
MVVFGGIRDVIRELNDLHVYSFRESQWITLQEPQPSPRETNKNTGPFALSGGKSDTNLNSPDKTDKKNKDMSRTGGNMDMSTTMKEKKHRSTTPSNSAMKGTSG